MCKMMYFVILYCQQKSPLCFFLGNSTSFLNLKKSADYFHFIYTRITKFKIHKHFVVENNTFNFFFVKHKARYIFLVIKKIQINLIHDITNYLIFSFQQSCSISLLVIILNSKLMFFAIRCFDNEKEDSKMVICVHHFAKDTRKRLNIHGSVIPA